MSPVSSRPTGPPWLTLLAIGVVVVLAVSVMLAFRPTVAIERSAIGFDGLARWADAQGMPVRRYDGAGPLITDGVGLRVLPLFTPDPTDAPALRFDEDWDVDLNADVRWISGWTIGDKAADLPTLIVFAKWRDGVRRLGLRHEDLLINAGAGDPVVRLSEPQDEESEPDPGEAQTKTPPDSEAAAPPEPGPIRTDKPGHGSVDAQGGDGEPQPRDDTNPEPVEADLTTFDPADPVENARPDDPLIWPALLPVQDDVSVEQSLSAPARFGGSVTLAAPQYAAAGENCRALVGEDQRGLVFECRWGTHEFWVVSDPDLLNNFGLTHGDNRQFATALLTGLLASDDTLGAREILLDYSTHNWVSGGEPRGRDLADLLRFFQPPFIWFWIAALALFAVALWRGAVRERALITVFREGHGAARTLAFRAQARLMRATRRDGALLRALGAARTAALCDLMLGHDEQSGERAPRMIAQVSRRDAALGERLQFILAAIADLPDRMAVDTAERALADLESVYQEAFASAGFESPK